ncbi:MAG: cytochrome c [gamma proteobacterium symbiont of Bathyaustriella thionipta]|nr:cytochrome c [gamma proteobacterium symbiont of Bathyaustriella thionipta]MCU7948496.1 cytochrome c [gamma proteobacterium symbiont of Bathyaustriella thionipta]MCU7952720.1 cytochrome c [gamma proteobacterium symbiont of Bathyaustriella thionipta]MCU7955496.1 cytochrome c [gamma proteobacterium symbiont of Bathyaustriella thionipta]MCU7966363.1 cytochrome c [gamma proteobacterium symbiont of Bathyaustriella thionipta]
MKILKKNVIQLIPLTLAVVFVSTPILAADSAAGKAVYDGKGACASCHGAAGAGDGVAAAALTPKPTNFAIGNYRLDTNGDGHIGSDADIANVIKHGAAQYGGNVSMPGRADFNDEEINSLVAYLKSMKK